MSVWGSFLDCALSVYEEHLLLLRQPQKMSFYLIQVSKCGIVFTILISYHSTCFILVSTSYYTNKRKKCKRCILFGFLLFWDAIMMVLLLSIGKSVFTEQPLNWLPQQCWRGRLKLQWRKGFNCEFLYLFSSISHCISLNAYLLPYWLFFCQWTGVLQVLLHLLRAGYFLHKREQSHSNGVLTDHEVAFPIRTIYFESPSAFPEINSFTYETATTWEKSPFLFQILFFDLQIFL